MKKLFTRLTWPLIFLAAMFLSCDYTEKHDYGSDLLYASTLWVVAVSPPYGSIAPVTTLITVVFSENINPATVDTSTFITSPPIPGTFSVVGTVVTLTPSALLVPFITYTVTLPNGGIQAVNGHSLEFTAQFIFLTN